MKKLICRILTKIERTLGIKPPKIAILGYHSISNDKTLVDVTPNNFKAQIDFLKLRFQFITLDQVVDCISGKLKTDMPCIVLTFDDGYADVLVNVAPILSQQNIPATLFVLAQPNLANRKELSVNKKLMTMKQVKKLHKAGWTIGCHSATHANLANKVNLGAEVADAKERLECVLGIKIKYFAYPKGIYNDKVIRSVKSAGFKAAFTTRGSVLANTDLYTIPRIGIDRTHSMAEFSAFFTNWANVYFRLKAFTKSFFSVQNEEIDFVTKRIWNEAPAGSRPGYLLPTLHREQDPSEAEIFSHSFTDSRPRFSAKGDKNMSVNKTLRI